jgi:hypothetical protein
LYRDYDNAFPRPPILPTALSPPPATPMNVLFDGLAPKDQVWDEESSNAMPDAPMAMTISVARRKSGGVVGAIGGAVGSAVVAPFGLVAAAAQSIARSGVEDKRQSSLPPGAPAKYRAEPVAAASVPRLDYAGLVMAPPAARDRGKLVAVQRAFSGDSAARVMAGITAIEQLALPPGHDAEWEHVYDYAFASDGAVDVKSDAAWHGIALTARNGNAKVRHVAVPREQADVFRVASIANPLDGPLLPGPIDVYDRGQFLVTSEVDYTPPGGKLDIGLGVDAQVKIARNVEFHEEATGMLRGGLRLVHAVTIEVENLAPRTIDLEIRERVPVTREGEDDIEVTIGRVEPAWERWTPDAGGPREDRLRGGYRWKLPIAANHKQLVRASYEVRIAGKHELVGGNRREP